MTRAEPSTPVSPLLQRPVGAVVASAVVFAILVTIAVIAADSAGAGNVVLGQISALSRHGAPVSAVLVDLAAAMTLGAAAVAGWVVRGAAARERALLIAVVSAGVWTLAQAAALVFSYSLATGQSVGTERFGSDMAVYLGTDLGVWMVTGLVVAAVTTTVALLGRSTRLARAVSVLAGLGLFAKAMTGHSASSPNHEAATSTMLIHLLAVGLWVGALIVLQLLPEEERDVLGEVRRYSHLALIAWTALALSGIWALVTRMNGPGDLLTSAYVQLAAGKTILLLVLAAMGVLQRRALAQQAGETAQAGEARRRFHRLALLELLLMGVAVSLAAAMSSSPPPNDEAVPALGPAAVLSGYPLPPAPELPGVLLTWRADPFWIALAAVLLMIWWRPSAPPRPRRGTALLVAASVLMVLVTNGPLNPYAKVLISAHTLLHLLLVAVGALLACIPSHPQHLLGITRLPQRYRTPVLLLLAFAGPALLGLVYAVPWLLRPALEGHAAHLLLQLLAVAAGAVTALAVRAAQGTVPRLLALAAAALPLVAGAVVLAVGDAVVMPSWFGATGRTWRADALLDQQQGGVVLLAVLAIGVAAAMAAVLRAGRAARA